MNSLDMLEHEPNPEIHSKHSFEDPLNRTSETAISENQIISHLKFYENLFKMENLNGQNKDHRPKLAQMFDPKQMRIQERLMRFNEPQLHEIKEESTILEKSNSTSKIMSSNFQSRILTNSLINNSNRKKYFIFI